MYRARLNPHFHKAVSVAEHLFKWAPLFLIVLSQVLHIQTLWLLSSRNHCKCVSFIVYSKIYILNEGCSSQHNIKDLLAIYFILIRILWVSLSLTTMGVWLNFSYFVSHNNEITSSYRLVILRKNDNNAYFLIIMMT